MDGRPEGGLPAGGDPLARGEDREAAASPPDEPAAGRTDTPSDPLPGRGMPKPALVAAAGALLLMPLVYLPQLHQIHSLPKVAVFRVAVVVVLAAWAVRLLARLGGRAQPPPAAGGTGLRDRRRYAGAPSLLLAAFLFWLAVASAFSEHVGASVLGLSPRYEGLLGFIGYGVFFWTSAHATAGQARTLLRALTASGAILALLALLEMLGPYRPPGFEVFGSRAVSTLGNPVFVGAWIALSLPGALALLALTPRRRERAAIIVSLAPQAAALYLTAARGPWLGTALGLMVALALAVVVVGRKGTGAAGRRRLAAAVAASTLVAVLAVSAAVAFRPDVTAEAGARLGEVVSAGQTDAGGSSATRLLQWRATTALIAERPLLGWGLESFLAEFPRVRPIRLVEIEGAGAYPDRPHDHPLYLAFSGGVPAALLYGLFFAALVAITLGSVLSGRHSWQRRLALCGLLGAVTAYEAQALFSFSLPWITAGAAALQGLLLALAVRRPMPDSSAGVRVGRAHSVGEEGPRPLGAVGTLLATRPTSLRVATGVAGVLLLALTVPFFTETLRQAWADVDFARVQRQPWEALRLTERAVRLSPRDADYVLGRGEALERAAATSGVSSLLEEAAEMYRHAEERIPSHPDIRFSLARVLTLTGETGEAMAEYEMLLERDPYHAGALFNLALLRLQTGDPGRAVAPLEVLTSYAPSDAEAWYYLGSAREVTGDLTGAAAAYGRSLEAAPGFPQAVEALEGLGS